MSDERINYSELGQVHEQHRFYSEGEIFSHPSGAIYKVVDRVWKLIQLPDGTPVE